MGGKGEAFSGGQRSQSPGPQQAGPQASSLGGRNRDKTTEEEKREKPGATVVGPREAAPILPLQPGSGGHARAVVWVHISQKGGGAERWCAISQGLPPPRLWGLPARLVRRRAVRGRGKWRERPPFLSRWCATGQGEVVRPNGHTISPPRRGVAPSTVIPGGKAIEPARRPAPGTAEPGSGEETDRSSPTGNDRHPEDRSLYPHVRRVEPHGCQLVEGFVPIRSVAIPLSTHPFTARKVHGNPIQNGGYNEGNSSAMECVSYLYQ